MQVEELKMVNPSVLKKYGLGSYETMQLKLQAVSSLDSLMMQRQYQSSTLGGPLPSMQELQVKLLQHNAATTIQKHIRGQLSRRRIMRQTQALQFFRKVLKTVQVRQLVIGIKNAFIHAKNKKQRFLKKYIFKSATRI